MVGECGKRVFVAPWLSEVESREGRHDMKSDIGTPEIPRADEGYEVVEEGG
jgi:hypothetical protein